MTVSPFLERTCQVWETADAVEPVPVVVSCRSVIVLGEAGADPRFAFVSVGSPVEKLLAEGTEVFARDGSRISVAELASRLTEGEVAGVIAPRGAVSQTAGEVVLPAAFLERRRRIRLDNVAVRFLIRQIGLEEVATHRGAPPALYEAVASRWSIDLALCTDPGMLLSLGADRQRHVDSLHVERATERLPRALGRLHDLGVRAYPRLVIV